MAGCRLLRALPDPNLLQDPRVLWNLLFLERRQKTDYEGDLFLQPEITRDMQEILAHWLLEVCEDQRCELAVFPLAMCYLRKCLSLFPVPKKHLQLLGTVCILLASKMKNMVPLNVDTLENYTACSVTAAQIRQWESYILCWLHWDLEIIISHDFLEHILERLLLSPDVCIALIRHSRIYMTVCALDYNVVAFAPSVIASACVVTALFRLGLYPSPANDLIIFLAGVIQADPTELQNCLGMIEPTLNKAVETSDKFRNFYTENISPVLNI